MQTFESMLSLLVLLSFSIFLLIASDSGIDNSLYLYSLAGDVKNVMHLKGGLDNISKGNALSMKILEETGLCMEFDQTQITSNLVEKGLSSEVFVPNLKDFILNANGTTIQIKNANLTGFTKDRLIIGTCYN